MYNNIITLFCTTFYLTSIRYWGEASKGDVVGGTWTVVRRVGSGRTSVVLLANNGERNEVLKIARSDEHGIRLRGEYEILCGLRDRSIIEPYGLEEIGGRTVIRLEPALGTLGEEIRKNGALSLDLLERYGNDLLSAVAHLGAEGVAHRDIKPDNIWRFWPKAALKPMSK